MRITGLIAVTAVIAACSSGGDGGTPPQPQPASMEVSIVPATTMTSVGDTRSAAAVVRAANGAVIQGSSVTWTSSSPSVATVSPATGAGTTVTAVGSGLATITGRAGNATDGEVVTVTQAFAKLTVSPGTSTINKSAPGNTAQLTATPQDARNNTMTGLPPATFSSGTPSVATVNATRLVTAVDIGTAIITASLTAGTVTQTGTSTITVQGAPAPQTVTVNAGQAGDTFSPTPITINRSDIVRYNFVAGLHNVTFATTAGAPSDISNTTPPAAVDRVFNTSGTFNYQCTNHSGMTGTVVVNP